MTKARVVVVGGGIVGLATAWQLQNRWPELAVTLLEKEPTLAAHQTGHNSGVIHSGIYYKPGSQKALQCRSGKAALIAFCEQHGLPFDICGKVIVAVDESEHSRLESIYERGQQNGVHCERISSDRLKELEPHVAGVAALHVSETGIVNYTQVTEKLADLVRSRGGTILTGAAHASARQVHDEVRVATAVTEIPCDYLIACAGLHSDRVANNSGCPTETRIVPFRGEYFELKPEYQHLVKNLIYPVPDPSFPFLGVHFTRMIGGGVECGPNAVLAFAREGYRKTDVNVADLCGTLGFRGFRSLAWKHWRMGAGEMWRSFSKAAFVKALQRLLPEIRGEHLVPARAGVRAQAVSPDGALVDDFLIETRGRMIHVLNAPSPAATSSLQIGKSIADRLAERMG